jgi:hypothetical protein
MFDLTKQPILVLALAAVASITFGACFNGNDADGLPCSNDEQCGPGAGCINGYCAGVFLCDDDGTRIDATQACDGEVDCKDSSDEDIEQCGGPGAGVNQCEAPDGDLAYRLGSSARAPDNAIKVEALDIMGSPFPDAIVASRDGDHVKISFDLESTAPKEYYFESPPPSFGERSVFGFQVGEVNGDMKPDVVIITTGTDAAVYVYQNLAPQPPELFGPVIVVPEMLGATLNGFELGRLNNDSSTDAVAVVDIALAKGVLLVSLGDSTAAAADDQYFTPELLASAPLGYEVFVDSTLVDIDGNGFDDLLVVGARQNGPTLWLVRRNGTGIDSWEDPILMPVMSPGWLAAGHFTNATTPGEPLPGMPDIAILDPNGGRIESLLNDNGMLMPGPTTTLTGSGFAGLTLADLNCDEQADFIYSLTDPPEIQVLFGNGLGGTVSSVPLAYADEGTPRGGLGIALMDEDSTPDIFTAAGPGDGQMEAQVRVLVSGAE